MIADIITTFYTFYSSPHSGKTIKTKFSKFNAAIYAYWEYCVNWAVATLKFVAKPNTFGRQKYRQIF